jgi:hypothetical protein
MASSDDIKFAIFKLEVNNTYVNQSWHFEKDWTKQPTLKVGTLKVLSSKMDPAEIRLIR